MVKAWLESTTWMVLPMNAYEDGPRCKVPTLHKAKKVDLRGHRLGKHRRDVFVESKRKTYAGDQYSEFREWLAIAYSHHLKVHDDIGQYPEEDFLWVTGNPFRIGEWKDLCSEAHLTNVLEDPIHAPYLGGRDIDPGLVRTVADGLWLLVYSDPKQIDLSLTGQELGDIMKHLDRGGNDLWSR